MSRRERSALEKIAWARRTLAAVGRSVADADEFELAELVELRDELERAIATAIAGQRSYGRSWAHIGNALGISRQAAQQHYGERVSA